MDFLGVIAYVWLCTCISALSALSVYILAALFFVFFIFGIVVDIAIHVKAKIAPGEAVGIVFISILIHEQ